MTYTLREVRDDSDISSIVALYSRFVRGDLATWAYAEEVPTDAEYKSRWLAAQARALPWLVACAADDGAVIGFCYVGDFRGRLGWRFTCEHSVYVEPRWARRGVGRALLAACVERSRAAGVARLVAVISVDGASGAGGASVALHESLGFARAGFLGGPTRR
jgi:L-amino acid N-acyltransferase YncA